MATSRYTATVLQRITASQWSTLSRCIPSVAMATPTFPGCGCHELFLVRLASNRVTRRLEKLGIGPDGKPLPTPNIKKVFPRMYKVLMVNQDGSTYTVRHRYPHQIITMPLDLSTLTPEQLAEREKAKAAGKARVYVEEKLEDDWDQRQYTDLIK